RLAPVQAEGRGRGDEVDLMSASRKLDAQLGRNYAAAAVGGVTRNADLAFGSHAVSFADWMSAARNLTQSLYDPTRAVMDTDNARLRRHHRRGFCHCHGSNGLA